MVRNKEYKTVFVILGIFFALFLAVPVVGLLLKSVVADGGLTLENYKAVFGRRDFLQALKNSFLIASCSAGLTTILAFILAYTVNYTNVPQGVKKFIQGVAVLPMLLPTLTYGFAIIYSFGKQGLLTRLLGRQFFEIYGFNGLLLGYTIYTLPISFMLIHNTMGYIDKKYMVVSRIMGDSVLQSFWMTVVRPLLGTLAASFIQSFFLCFTDFGIPASVGGKFEVIASVLYSEMLGSVPNFGNGAVVAFVMLIPSVISITVLQILERYNIRYNRISVMELSKNRLRDGVCTVLSGLIILGMLSIFAVIFVVPADFIYKHRRQGDIPKTCRFVEKKEIKKMKDKKRMKQVTAAVLAAIMGISTVTMTGCGSSTADEQIIIYSNADEEAIEAMSETLDENGYKDQYVFQTFGTSELGGKLLAEGKNLEADMVTMSTFYVDSAQEANEMFKDLEFDVKTLDEFGSYCAPITSQEGTIIINTDLLKENNLPAPTCLKDLADPVYKDMISVTDVASSSTAWLLIQALVSEYGEDGAKDILTDIYKNAGCCRQRRRTSNRFCRPDRGELLFNRVGSRIR